MTSKVPKLMAHVPLVKTPNYSLFRRVPINSLSIGLCNGNLQEMMVLVVNGFLGITALHLDTLDVQVDP